MNSNVSDLTFEELLTKLKLDSLSWYKDEIPDEYLDVANHLYKVRAFFKDKNSPFIKDIESHVLNSLLLLRNTMSDEIKNL